MDDIARHLGISRSTVSFVINGRTDIRIAEETKRRVWEAVAELGYRPHAG
jgi:LacI family transcriptional regulator